MRAYSDMALLLRRGAANAQARLATDPRSRGLFPESARRRDFNRRGVRASVRATRSEPTMALEVFWGSGSGPAWRVLLALAIKGVPYESKLLSFAKREHKSEEILALTARGKVPV